MNVFIYYKTAIPLILYFTYVIWIYVIKSYVYINTVHTIGWIRQWLDNRIILQHIYPRSMADLLPSCKCWCSQHFRSTPFCSYLLPTSTVHMLSTYLYQSDCEKTWWSGILWRNHTPTLQCIPKCGVNIIIYMLAYKQTRYDLSAT